MTINTTHNTRVGFFLGKGPHITSITSFTEWVQDRLRKHSHECPPFQLNVEGIGRYKDPSTKSRALVVICSPKNIKQLCHLLDIEFHLKSNFPFTPFQIMYSLDISTQTALYKAHKMHTFGNELLELTIPAFADLERKIKVHTSKISLRDACFDFKDSHGSNIFIDIDQSPCSLATVVQVKKG